MIKINLIKALRESAPVIGDAESRTTESKSFLEKLFPFKLSSEDSAARAEDIDPINPATLAVKIAICLMFVIGLFIYESINIPKLKSQLEEETQKLNQLAEYNNKASLAVAEIKKQLEHKTLIEKQIASLDGLSKVRLKYIKVLDLIQTHLPEKLWFLNLKAKESSLDVTGLAFSENEITSFLDTMGKSIYFSDVSMQSSEDVVDQSAKQNKYKKFNIVFTLEDRK